MQPTLMLGERDNKLTNKNTFRRNHNMFNWALTFFIVALIAAVFGFGGVAGAAVGIGKFIFFAAVILLVVSLVAGGLRGRV